MCGICGLAFSTRSGSQVQRSTIERMRDIMQYRGPDGAGLFVDGPIGLGHRRLSILDPMSRNQPMASDDGAIQVVYNGEIYNHPEIRRLLESEGRRYRTACDTESVLKLYERHGVGTPAELRGMFAFAIWDSRARTLMLARDRLGIKPLYYTLTDNGSLAFGSEIKAVLASGLIAARLDQTAIPEYLSSRASFGQPTMFAGIKRLEAGHTLLWRDGEVRMMKYWDVSCTVDPDDPRGDREIELEYAAHFRDAVRTQLAADVPIGTFLSGGIDSAAITATMSQLIDEPVKTFSVAFAEQEASELHWARLVANRFHTEHREVIVSPQEFFDAWPTMLWHEDEPIAYPSSIPLAIVSRLAQRQVKVVLTGEGSDEVLGGYNRYRATMYNMRFGERYERLLGPGARRMVRATIDALPRHSRLRQLLTRTFLKLPADLTSLYLDNFAVFSPQMQFDLASEAARVSGIGPAYPTSERVLAESDANTLLGRLLYADIKTSLGPLLLRQDQMSMAASIESRVPFLDHPLVEFSARMPDRMKIRGTTTKYVLRQCMEGILPAEILNRPKMGFPVPVGAWLRGAFTHALDEFVLSERTQARGLFNQAALRKLVASHRSGERDQFERLWSLINLEMWQRLQLDGESVEDLKASLTPARRGSLGRRHPAGHHPPHSAT